MPRRTRRTRRYSRSYKVQKYSNETYNFVGSDQLSANGNAIPLVAPIESQGMRKCKNFTLTIACSAQITVPLIYALVYVPQGTQASRLNVGENGAVVSLYEPNQNVILSGILSYSQEVPITKYSRLARNLNSGDSIQLIVRAVNGEAVSLDIAATLNYAISY